MSKYTTEVRFICEASCGYDIDILNYMGETKNFPHINKYLKRLKGK